MENMVTNTGSFVSLISSHIELEYIVHKVDFKRKFCVKFIIYGVIVVLGHLHHGENGKRRTRS